MLWNECLFLNSPEEIAEMFIRKDDILLIVGKGFDPRACVVLDFLSSVVSEITVCLVDYNDRTKKEDIEKERMCEENYRKLLEACEKHKLIEADIPLYGGGGNKRSLVISESVRNALTLEMLSEFGNILIDVSAMPRGVSFSIINRVLGILDKEKQRVYIFACANSGFDEIINPVINDGSAEYLPGFNTFSMSMESDNDNSIIWLPALGLNVVRSFEIIADFLNPKEICPVVPFPSDDVKRGERILRYYGQTIFRDRGVEKRNIIYVPENNPILVYRKLYDTVKYYEKALKGASNNGRIMKYAFSSQSSKLIDVGMLLAVINLNSESIRTGIVIVENQGYNTCGVYDEKNNHICCLCLHDNDFGW